MKRSFLILVALILAGGTLVSCGGRRGEEIETGKNSSADKSAAQTEKAEFTAPAENGVAEFCDGVLMMGDASLHFEIADDYNNASLWTAIELVEERAELFDDHIRLVFDGTVMLLRHEKKGGGRNFYIESVKSHGYKHTFEDKEPLFGLGEMSLLSTDEAFIYSRKDKSSGKNIIFTDGGIIENSYSGPMSEGYDDPVITYTIRDGVLRYTRIPRKYAFDFEGNSKYWKGADEVCREEGYITFENGELVYNGEKTLTAAEVFNMEESPDGGI